MTSGNREWAYREAQRRSIAMVDAYSIYKHPQNDDYIVRNAHAAKPENWSLVATFHPCGQTFGARE